MLGALVDAHIRRMPDMAHTVYILGDLHLGAGREPVSGEWDDLERFRDDETFAALLDTLGAETSPAELVIAGDFIDFPRIVPALAESFPTERLGATEADSVARAALALGLAPQTATGHPIVFEALRRFMTNGHSVTIVVGERDIDLLWPEVWALVFDAIYPPGAPGELRRRALSHTIGTGAFGRLYIEHGHEYDATCRYGDRMKHPFAQDMSGTWRIYRPWGARFADRALSAGMAFDLDTTRPATQAILDAVGRAAPLPPWALVMAARFLLAVAAPRDRAVAADEPVWPLGRRGAAALVEALHDRKLREYLLECLTDTTFSAAFERELGAIADAEWSVMAAGIENQPLLERAAACYNAVSLGMAQHMAAGAILEAEPALGTVVMGHTHHAIDGHEARLARSDGRAGYFFNCGAWALPADADAGARVYLRCTPDVWGAYHVEICRQQTSALVLRED